MKNYDEIIEFLGYGILKAKIIYKNNIPYDIEYIDYNDKIKEFVSKNPEASLDHSVKNTFKNDPLMLNLMEGFIHNIDKINNKTICVYSDKTKSFYEISSFIK
jgi:hypothetical protein